MKAWALADSKMGYISNWKLYCGKEEEAGSEPLGVGFGSCGTVWIDRHNILAKFKEAAPKKGEIATYHDGELLGLKWKDKWLGCMLSTIHDDSMFTKQRCT